MQRTIMVLGVTGLMGHRIATHLAERFLDAQVAGAARHATGRSAELPSGLRLHDVDLENPDSFGDAFTGLTDLVIAVAGRPGRFDAIEHRGVVAAARAAAEGGVGRIVHISGTAAPTAPDWCEAAVAKRWAEAELRALDACVVTLRPSWLMEALPRFERGGGMKLIGAGRMPIRWLALDDLAAVVAEVLERPEIEPGAYPVLGPEAVSLREAAERYARARGLGNGVRSLPMPLARAIAAVSPRIRYVTELIRVFERFDEAPLTHIETPFRRPATTLDQWLKGL